MRQLAAFGSAPVDFLHVAVGAGTEKHPDGATGIQTRPGIAGIFHGGIGQFQHQALLRIHDPRFIGTDAEELGGKLVDVRQRPHAVLPLAALPARRRHRRHHRTAGLEGLPESIQALATRETCGIADDGDGICLSWRLRRRRQRCRAPGLGNEIDHLLNAAALQQQGITIDTTEMLFQACQHLDGLDRVATQLAKAGIQRDLLAGALQHLRPDAPDCLGRCLLSPPWQARRIAQRPVLSRIHVRPGRVRRSRRLVGMFGQQGIMTTGQPLLHQLIALQLAAGGTWQTRQRDDAGDRIAQPAGSRLTYLLQPLPEIGAPACGHEQHHLFAPRVRVGGGTGGDAAILERKFLA